MKSATRVSWTCHDVRRKYDTVLNSRQECSQGRRGATRAALQPDLEWVIPEISNVSEKRLTQIYMPAVITLGEKDLLQLKPFAIILLVVPLEDAETKTGWVTRSEQSRIHLAPYTLHFKPRQCLPVSCCGDAYPSSRQREEGSLGDKMLTVEAGEANLYNNEKKRKETSAFQC